ncbi:MAG: hypothetical protein A4E28_02823 [Methanocella sp. PtaU1.Bin125]|nr:MAG: hypothetical protein A4E28_02823 [Methanocella sp. PtaU1.Bin125]
MALFRRERREDLPSRIERKGSQLSQTAAERGAETSRRVSDILRRASEDIKSMHVSDYRDRAMEAMGDTAEMARGNIRAHPLASIVIAAGLGMALGAAIGMIGTHTIEKTVRESRY